MDQYIGGIEHAVLHLLYARFWTKVMRDLGLVKFDEPFTRLFTQGMLLAECFYREEENGRKRWFYPSEIDVKYDDKGRPVGAVALNDGQPVTLRRHREDVEVEEQRGRAARHHRALRRRYRARLRHVRGSACRKCGVVRFRRGWRAAFPAQAVERVPGREGERVSLTQRLATLTPAQANFRRMIHVTLKQALHDYTRVQYNTVVSACMKMLNGIETDDAQSNRAVLAEAISILLRTLYPIAPHVTHALWTELGFSAKQGELLDAPWPAVDEGALKQDEVEVVVQVNGKLRGRITIPATADEAVVRDIALADETVKKFTGDKPLRKLIFVPGKLVNLVV